LCVDPLTDNSSCGAVVGGGGTGADCTVLVPAETCSSGICLPERHGEHRRHLLRGR